MRRIIMEELKNLLKVLKQLRYFVTALTVSVIIFSVSVWIPNSKIIWHIINSGNVELHQKIIFLWNLYGSISTNFNFFSATYTVLIAILFGINISLLVYYIREQKDITDKAGANPTLGTTIGGLVAGFFGIGCAACGTFLLSGLFALFGAGAVLTFLPLGGGEFGIIGVVLLGYSMRQTLQKIQTPGVCNVL